jgi:hypothetical protein
MNVRLRAMLLVVVCGALSAAQAVTPLESERDRVVHVLNGVCAWALNHPGSGLAADRRLLDPLLAPSLALAFAQAKAAEANYVKAAAADEKPELLEGDLILGGVEGATEIALGEPRIDGKRAQVEVTAIYIDERFPKASRNRVVVWTNVVELVLADNVWRVFDVLYRGDAKQRLSTTLREYAEGG